MRTIGVVTCSRAEYGILRAVLKRIVDDDSLHLFLYVGGSHLSPEFGMTIKEVERDGLEIMDRIECLVSSDTPSGIAKSMGLTMLGFAQAYARCAPDVLLVTADRFEMAAATMAAVPFNIPIAHHGGGDVTLGAFDEQFRHAMTKLSHLHFVTNEDAKRRVLAMGEEGWRVTVTGNPALDSIPAFDSRPHGNYLLVVFHPVTLEKENTAQYIDNLCRALSSCGLPITFILGNCDTYGRVIHRRVKDFASNYALSGNVKVIPSIAPTEFYRLAYNAAALVGNSSAGLLEAPTLRLPVVNIGTRQDGRLRAQNVIDVGYTQDEIAGGIAGAIRPEFRESLRDIVNPYGDGHAAERIVRILKQIDLRDILVKRFVL